MAYQVDVKALVSHIVRGDGADRCRICMGNTTEGQVFLGDTVMLDEERPVTLAELLETLTGVEVTLDDELPTYLCMTCTTSILDFAKFRIFCKNSQTQWKNTVLLLETLPEPDNKKTKGLFAIISNNELVVLNEFSGGLDKKAAVKKLNSRFYRMNAESTKTKCSCPDCGKTFLYPHRLHVHLRDTFEDKRACYICADIMKRDELVKHLAELHDQEAYPCDKCSSVLKSAKYYARHLQDVHVYDAITCGECGRSYQSLPAFNAHTSVHKTKTCEKCQTTFTNIPCYTYHIKHCPIDHIETINVNNELDIEEKFDPDLKPVKLIKNKPIKDVTKPAIYECFCDHCGKRFSLKRYLRAHIQIVHSTATHKICVYCGKYLAAAHMTEHVKRHEQVTTYTCNICGLILKTGLGIKQHLRLHTGEKPYKCKVCGEAFSASSRRSAHVRSVHQKIDVLKYSCDKCVAKFRRPYQLKRHMKTVHLRPANEIYSCTECGEKFGSFLGLMHHKRKHQVLQTPYRFIDEKEDLFEVKSKPTKQKKLRPTKT